MISEYLNRLKASGQRINVLSGLMEPDKPLMSQANARAALVGPTAVATGTQPALQIRAATADDPRQNYKPLVDDPNSASRVIGFCEAVTTVDCNKFDDPTFAGSCGICHKPAQNSRGVMSLGGRYIYPSSRDLGIPAVGSCPRGSMSLTKEQCLKMKEQTICEQTKNFSSPNCRQCFTTGDWVRIPTMESNPTKLNAKLYVIGRGWLTFKSDFSAPNLWSGQLSDTPVEIPLKNFPIEANVWTQISAFQPGTAVPPGTPIPETYVAGVLAGPTRNGVYAIDMYRIVTLDFKTSARPRTGQIKTVRGYTATPMRPQPEQASMETNLWIPLTYLDSTDEDAALCPSGPIIMTQEAANYLQSDVCYRQGSGPGAYSLDCYQDRFKAAGGTSNGTLYPRTAADAQTLNTGNRNIAAISDEFYQKAVIAATGRTVAGTDANMASWDQASREMLGITRSSPCDQMPANGPLTRQCLTYLYNNGGLGGEVGATYTSGLPPTSLTGDQITYCRQEGKMNPATDAGYNALRTKGGISQVKEYLNQLHQKANAVGITDAQRAEAMENCYGITLAGAALRQTDYQAAARGKMVSLVSGAGNYLGATAGVVNAGGSPGTAGAKFYKEEPAPIGRLGTVAYRSSTDPKYRIGRSTANGGSGVIMTDSLDVTSLKEVDPICGNATYKSYVLATDPSYYLANISGTNAAFVRGSTLATQPQKMGACWKEVDA